MRERVLLYTDTVIPDGQGGIELSSSSSKELWADVSSYKHTKEQISGAQNNKKEVSIIIRKDSSLELKIGTIIKHGSISYRVAEIEDHKAPGAPETLRIYWKMHGVEV